MRHGFRNLGSTVIGLRLDEVDVETIKGWLKHAGIAYRGLALAGTFVLGLPNKRQALAVKPWFG